MLEKAYSDFSSETIYICHCGCYLSPSLFVLPCWSSLYFGLLFWARWAERLLRLVLLTGQVGPTWAGLIWRAARAGQACHTWIWELVYQESEGFTKLPICTFDALHETLVRAPAGNCSSCRHQVREQGRRRRQGAWEAVKVVQGSPVTR